MMHISSSRKVRNSSTAIFCGLAFACAAVPLISIMWSVLSQGIGGFSWTIFTQVTNGISGGLLNAIEGTLVLSIGALVIAGPIGVMAGIFLSESAGGRWAAVVRFLADVLAGVPSIVLGYFAYVTMVVGLGWQFSVLAGIITLAILTLPYIARFTEVSMRQNPPALRESAYALGCRQSHVILRILLPNAKSGVITGILLSLAISVGETAPLIYTAGWSNYMWSGKFIHEPVGYLTYVIWSFISQPFDSAHQLAYSAAVLVVVIVLAINLAARYTLKRMSANTAS